MQDGFAEPLPRQWEFALPLASQRTLDGLLGIELVERGSEHLRAEMAIRDPVRQPIGFVHGGAYAALAQMLASIGTLDGVSREGKTAFVVSNDTDVLVPVSEGRISAHARLAHKSTDSWFWEVRMSTEQGTCALCRVTVAVGSPDELGIEPVAAVDDSQTHH